MYAFYRSQLFRFVALVSQLPLWLASRVFARSAKQAMSVLSLSLVLNTPIIVRAQERVGTSCADCPLRRLRRRLSFGGMVVRPSDAYRSPRVSQSKPTTCAAISRKR
jgi:hypothetical protein